MKRILLTLTLAAAACAGSLQAQLLWKVSGNGANGDTYIFGTHHVAPASMIDSVAGLRAALQGASAIVGEINMDESMTQEAQVEMMKWGMAPADSMLTAVLTTAQADSVNALMSEFTGGALPNAVEAMAQMKPNVLVTQLALMESMKIFPGFDPTKQLDATLQALAREQGKPSKGLETVGQQFAILFGAPIAEQADDLMSAVADSHSGKAAKQARELADAYLAENINTIYNMMVDDKETTPAEAERLIFGRNRAWAAVLPAMMAEEPLFVAVGAGHLPGPEGLLELLRKAGYTVTAVSK